MKHHEEHKEHKRHHRETGGKNDAEEDLKHEPEARVNAKEEDREAEEKKRGGEVRMGKDGKHHKECKCHKCMGGRARRRGGRAHGGHAEGFGPEDQGTKAHFKRGGHAHKEHEKKHEEHKVKGEHEHHRADRHARKGGGRAGADSHPFSSARSGKPAPGRKVEDGADYE